MHEQAMAVDNPVLQVKEKCLRKCVTLTLGTLRHVDVGEVFRDLGFQKEQDLGKCDLVLALCPPVAFKPVVRILDTLPDNKPVVVMVLHYPCDVTDVKAVRAVKRQNTIAVNCLFCDDEEFLQYTANNEARARIQSWLSSEESFKTTSKKSPPMGVSVSRPQKPPALNYSSLISGKALGHDLKIERKLQEENPNLRKVQNLEESELILVFCPVVSRARTDIEAAVNMLNTKAGNKAAVLLVLHHTFDPHHIVPDSRRAVKREKLIAVDCLFHEDLGLLTCSQNDDALSQVGNWLRLWKK